jgi:nitrogen fixation NifU-like protein
MDNTDYNLFPIAESPEPDSKFLQHVQFPKNLGVLPDPNGHACLRGVCGDLIEVGIRVKDGVINDIRVLPDGCSHTTACASAMSGLAKGRNPDEASQMDPKQISDLLGGLPEDHLHCAQLAVECLGAAVEDYYRHANSGDAG